MKPLPLPTYTFKCQMQDGAQQKYRYETQSLADAMNQFYQQVMFKRVVVTFTLYSTGL